MLGQLYRFRLVAENANGSSQSSGLLATLGEGFGIKSFEVSFLNEDGTPDTQAGSHPYELVNNIEFKSHYKRKESNADAPSCARAQRHAQAARRRSAPRARRRPQRDDQEVHRRSLNCIQGRRGEGCPRGALLGGFNARWSSHLADGDFSLDMEPVYNMVAARGVALQLGTKLVRQCCSSTTACSPVATTLSRRRSTAPPASAGAQEQPHDRGRRRGEGNTPRKAFLTLPTGCHGPLRSTISKWNPTRNRSAGEDKRRSHAQLRRGPPCR